MIERIGRSEESVDEVLVRHKENITELVEYLKSDDYEDAEGESSGNRMLNSLHDGVLAAVVEDLRPHLKKNMHDVQDRIQSWIQAVDPSIHATISKDDEDDGRFALLLSWRK